MADDPLDPRNPPENAIRDGPAHTSVIDRIADHAGQNGEDQIQWFHTLFLFGACHYASFTLGMHMGMRSLQQLH